MRRYYIKVGAKVGSPFFLCQTKAIINGCVVTKYTTCTHRDLFCQEMNTQFSSDYCLMIMSNRD